mmetsp:Transcript_42660/g.110286  ORF Transcript_42660/g.110286 Transcript_42660/m.110286 type:complete len:486 (+) Transcript_42660:74-1531(+)
MATAQSELSARQRKHVHMHSSIFSTDGPTTKSVYAPARQQELYKDVSRTLRANNIAPPEIQMPSAADIKCTQNAGHGAVLPGGGQENQRALRPGPAGRPAGVGPSPRTTSECLVYDGEPHNVVRASGRDSEAIPKEFWNCSVNLQWHDTRNEQCRQRGQAAREGRSAQECKRHEFSSEIFGKPRNTTASTSNAKQELLADTANPLECDSALFGRKEEHGHHRERMQRNLTNSVQSTMARQEPVEAAPMVENEAPAGRDRRRQEKNFSDLFGTEMRERRAIYEREEILCANNCSFLDSRGEIASRNKQHWRQADGAASDHKQAEQSSHLFHGSGGTARPISSPEQQQAIRSERTCWDTAAVMEASSEIARRQRTRDHTKEYGEDQATTHLMRKQEMMSSQQVMRNMQELDARRGGYPEPASVPVQPAVASSPHVSQLQNGEETERGVAPRLLGAGARAGPGKPEEREEMLKSARGTKLASMQSNIF